MTPLILPVTFPPERRAELGQQQLLVLEAIRELQAAMRLAAPNPRDYITGIGFDTALLAWHERQTVIDDLYNEIEMHAMQIAVGGK